MHIHKVLCFVILILTISCSKESEDVNLKDSLNLSYNYSFKTLASSEKDIPDSCKKTSEARSAFFSIVNILRVCPVKGHGNNKIANDVKTCLFKMSSFFEKTLASKHQECAQDISPYILNEMSKSVYLYHTENVKIEKENGGYNYNNLRKYFELINLWYESTNLNLLFSNVQNKVSYLRKNLISPIWKTIQSDSLDWREMIGLVKTNDIKKVANFNTFQTTMCTNIKVLNSASVEPSTDLKCGADYKWDFDNSNPLNLKEEVYAIILEASLRSLHERMLILTKTYDITCKLKTCDNDFPKKTLLNGYLEFLSDPLKWKKSIYELEEGSVSSFLQFISSNRNSNYFDNIIKYAEQLPEDKRTFSLEMLLTKVKIARGFVKSHNKTGFYYGDTTNDILAGFDKQSFKNRLSIMAEKVSRFGQKVKELDSNKLSLMQEVLHTNSSNALRKKVANQIKKDLSDFLFLNKKIALIKKEISDESNSRSEQLSDLVKQTTPQNPCYNEDPDYLECKDASEDAQWNYYNQPISTGLRQLSISSNKLTVGSGVHHKNINLFAINSKKPLKIKANEQLHFNIRGVWSPTCAIEETYSRSKGATTGPQGFISTFNKGKSDVTSVNDYETDEDYRSLELSANACVGANFIDSLKIQSCIKAAGGHRRSWGTTKSHLTQSHWNSTAAFNLGIRHNSTPFPDLPAGSLIAVVIPLGTDKSSSVLVEDAKEFIVLNRNSVIQVNEDSDVYIVGNDCKGDDDRALHISVSKFTPKSVQAIKLANAFIENLDIESIKYEELIKGGIFNQDDVNTYINKVFSKQDIRSLGIYNTLFKSWIYTKISILKRKTELVTLERQSNVLSNQLEFLVKQFNSLGIDKQIHSKIREKLLANLDLNLLNNSTSENNYSLNFILKALDNVIVTMVNFKYQGLKDHVVSNIYQLKNISLEDDFVTMSKNIGIFFDALKSNIEDMEIILPNVDYTPVAVIIPNPYFKTHDPVEEKNFRKYEKNYNVIKDGRGASFWKKLLKWKRIYSNKKYLKEQPSIKLEPKDLYENLEKNLNGISCAAIAPIIKRAGIYFLKSNWSNGDFTGGTHSFHAVMDGEFKVPFINGPKSYNFILDEWKNSSINTKFVNNVQSALDIVSRLKSDIFTNYEQGRSPFSTFRFWSVPNINNGEINGLKIKGNNIAAAIFVFDVHPIVQPKSHESLEKWLDNCKVN